MELTNTKIILDFVNSLKSIKEMYIVNTPANDRKNDYEFLLKFFGDGVDTNDFSKLGIKEFERVVNIIGIPDDDIEEILDHREYFKQGSFGDSESLNRLFEMLIQKTEDFIEQYKAITSVENDVSDERINQCDKYIKIFHHGESLERFDLDEFVEFLSMNGILMEERIVLINYILNKFMKEKNSEINIRNKVIAIQKACIDNANPKLCEEISEYIGSGYDISSMPYSEWANRFDLDEMEVATVACALLIDSYYFAYQSIEDSEKKKQCLDNLNKYIKRINIVDPVIGYAFSIIENNKVITRIPEDKAEEYYNMSVEEIMKNEGIGEDYAKRIKAAKIIIRINKLYKSLKRCSNTEYANNIKLLEDIVSEYNEFMNSNYNAINPMENIYIKM